jgi:hypothetical protein
MAMARKFARRLGAITGGCVVALTVWVGLGGTIGAEPLVPDPITCLPTCDIDGRSFVVAGDDPTTLAAQEITIGLNFTAAAGPTGNFELFDGDRVAANWDVPLNCGVGCPDNGSAAPELIIELFADPAGIGGSGLPIMTWTPNAVPSGTEQGPFPVTNNAWNGVTFTHDPAAINGTNYQYAIHIRPSQPSVDKGWNSFKVRAAGTVLLLGNQVVGFIGAMNNPGDINTIYPNGIGDLNTTVYDGTWSFKTRLPAFLGDVTIFDGDMDFGNAACEYNDTDDPDSVGVPPFALGSAAVDEGVAVANAPNTCSGGSGTRTGTPAEDNTAAAFRRVPSIVPAGIAYQIVAPDGQVFLNQNPSGNKEWEQFKIQLVDPGDVTMGACPVGGYPADVDKGYPASDCRTTSLPGGVWEVQLDGMDISNLNFWFFSFKVEPIVTEYSIGRLVWLDSNSNATQDPGEPGIPGVTYTVYDGPLPGGNVVRTGVTDANGEFLETGLPAGNYTVVVDDTNFAVAAPLNGLTSTTGGEVENDIEVGLPECVDTNVPVGCGEPVYNEAIFGYNREGGRGIIAPTSETCQDYASGTADTQYVMTYSVNGANRIHNNPAPGVIFFFTKVTVGAGETLTVAQSHTGTAPVMMLHQLEARVYTESCGNVTVSVSQDNTTGLVTFGALQPGTYILRMKYSGKSLVGAPAPNPSTSYYTFVAQLNGVADPLTQNDTPLALTKKN